MLRFGRAARSFVTRRPALGYLAVTIAYAVTGKLALLLAVPPGYASSIFPPSGIAVAAVMIGGRGVLPWVFFGALVLNLVGHETEGTGWAAAGVIASASTLQAAIGAAVFRRALGYPALLDNGRDLLRFLVLSPAFCLTSATLSLAGLWALGVVQLGHLATSWVSWWIGDTLGVLVVLPLMFVAAGEPRSLWRSRTIPVAVPMLLFFALFIAIFIRVSTWERDEGLLEFRLLSQELGDRIHSGLAEQEIFLQQLERSFSRAAPMPRADFRHLAKNLLQRFPAIQAVGWVPRVDFPQRAAFEAAQRAELPDFEIREIDGSGIRGRPGERDHYYPVTYVEPLEGNEQILGFDLLSEPGRKATVEHAINTGKVGATPPIRLVQQQGEPRGILLLFAVDYGPNGPGIVSVALRMTTFTAEIARPFEAALRVRLIDKGQDKVLYSGFAPSPRPVSYRDTFNFGGRAYGIETEPTAAYVEQHRRWQSWAVLVAGVVSTGLLGALLLLGTGYTRRIETVVDERTRDLETVNRRLQLEIKDRQQAEAALRQAQRMEAIGQLTGGIAHDFNNLLTVVGGNAALLRDKAPDDIVARRASAIIRAAEQGERLTRQLLAFSRRQMLRPEPVDLRRRTRDLAEMLSRSLREDIEVAIDMPEGLWPVTVDPAEFELALLNIGVNARDAMPNGGRFCVKARNCSFTPEAMGNEGLVGDFVEVTLSDTGTGMPAHVLARAFEPFFTTKEVGVGTGLGLSQVYGFAKQSGGAASVTSEIGKGTAIALLLPRAIEVPAAPSHPAGELSLPAVPARILLVEDDRDVANVTAELLRDLGCEAVSVRDGRDALALLESDPTIELVISDIVMPGGMSGFELAQTLRERRPELPVLLATGYSQYAEQVVKDGFILVEKPYRRDALTASIRAATDRVLFDRRPGGSAIS